MINHKKSCHSVLKGRVSCSEASAPLASTHQTTKMTPTFSVCVLSASTNASISRHLHLIFYGTNCILSMDILDWGMRTNMYLVTKVVKWLKSGKFVEVISVVCVYVFDTGRLWEESWSNLAIFGHIGYCGQQFSIWFWSGQKSSFVVKTSICLLETTVWGRFEFKINYFSLDTKK